MVVLELARRAVIEVHKYRAIADLHHQAREAAVALPPSWTNRFHSIANTKRLGRHMNFRLHVDLHKNRKGHG